MCAASPPARYRHHPLRGTRLAVVARCDPHSALNTAAPFGAHAGNPFLCARQGEVGIYYVSCLGMKLKSPLASQREIDKNVALWGRHADYRKLQSEIARAAAGERQPLAASRRRAHSARPHPQQEGFARGTSQTSAKAWPSIGYWEDCVNQLCEVSGELSGLTLAAASPPAPPPPPSALAPSPAYRVASCLWRSRSRT